MKVVYTERNRRAGNDGDIQVARLEVPGGWMYVYREVVAQHVHGTLGDIVVVNTVFVPNPMPMPPLPANERDRFIVIELCNVLAADHKAVLGSIRTQLVVTHRHLIMVALRRNGWTWNRVAAAMDRDRSTVQSAVEKMEATVQIAVEKGLTTQAMQLLCLLTDKVPA